MSRDEQDLPEPSEVEVLPALVSNPEPSLAQPSLDARVFAGEAAEDDERESDEQDHGERGLPPGLVARDERRKKDSGGQIRGRDPEDGELDVPGPRHVVRHQPGHVEAEEVRGLGAVVRTQSSYQGLDEEEKRRHQQIPYDDALSGSQADGFDGDKGDSARTFAPSEPIVAAKEEQDHAG